MRGNYLLFEELINQIHRLLLLRIQIEHCVSFGESKTSRDLSGERQSES